jgi:hypothetical protein
MYLSDSRNSHFASFSRSGSSKIFFGCIYNKPDIQLWFSPDPPKFYLSPSFVVHGWHQETSSLNELLIVYSIFRFLVLSNPMPKLLIIAFLWLLIILLYKFMWYSSNNRCVTKIKNCSGFMQCLEPNRNRTQNPGSFAEPNPNRNPKMLEPKLNPNPKNLGSFGF